MNGTALYYTLRGAEYYLPGMEYLFTWDTPVVLATYVTVAAQVLFPILVIFRPTRLFIVLIMMSFHLGIFLLMGLSSFALIMIGADTIFVNGHLARLFRRAGLERTSSGFCAQSST